MGDPNALLVALGVALALFIGTGVKSGAKKIGHGAKVVACKVHLAKCPAKAEKP